MMKSIHVISEPNDRGQPRNSGFDAETKSFYSGFWDLSLEKAESLKDGWIYFHDKKSSPSYYGGKISRFNKVYLEKHSRHDRIVFNFLPSVVSKGLKWRGQDHGNAWTGGLVEADLPYERLPE